MKHLSQAELVDQYYGEPSGRDARASHLLECNACSTEYGRLKAMLDAIAEDPVPERGADYGLQVWNRIRAHLPEHKQNGWRVWMRMSPQRWAVAAAMAALIIIAFFVGRGFRPQPPPTPTVAQNNKGKEQRVLLVALGDHLDRSQMMLIELVNTTDATKADITVAQQRAEQLLAENRLYRQAAERSGDNDVAAVLDELERVLVEVAHEPAQPSNSDLTALRQRIQSKGILFKVRVIDSNIHQSERKRAPQPAAISNRPRQTT